MEIEREIYVWKKFFLIKKFWKLDTRLIVHLDLGKEDSWFLGKKYNFQN